MLTFIYLLAATGATGNAEYAQEPPPFVKTAIELPAAPPSSAPPPPRGSWKRPNPIPKGNPGIWANTNDYPAIALQKELEGTTGFSLTVGSDGRVSDCQIISSSGSPELDQATCMNVTRRARFDPALDERGNAASGTYRNRIRWQIPKIMVPVPTSGSHKMTYTIETDGTTSDCKQTGSYLSEFDVCANAPTYIAPLDKTGNAVRKKVIYTSNIQVSDLADGSD